MTQTSLEKILVIIPASGKGSRYGSALPKQLLPFDGTTILEHTIEKFKQTKFNIDICLIIHDINDTLYQSVLNKVQYCVKGGAERQASISNAILSDFAPLYDIIAVHDAVRPLVSCTLIEELITQTVQKGAVIPALPIKDTLKTFSDNRITATLNRESILAVQTPQVFHSSVIISSYRTALSSKELFTDDSSLVEYSGYPVYYIQGEETNIKITTPSDYQYANFLIHKNLAR
ncbi:MAG TPA: 2-C-methyl-D-erythritol 4-phosphate cytidylyltransferase [Candidatus Kapabacteria bacterium]|jgi:2-C-methyl-D-erythritol 4-phosphate cytidylyltransferase|nr:2-C-methyl-D-erythritol 4-phosphate cytidylyltransferase [Candidatus Kapabacteria bacterium]HRI29898.1 2-C-methyl-D-erythritol 4-phosphate cytidylyltransferase [Candidatus Kapabacteria bacterium]HRK58406.1 2-C-methyl-D-erythritol 4-phosphate cytidylyltransferase [Candidatus Kapabacteria bacterium]